MKLTLILFLLIILNSKPITSSSDYDVANFYNSLEPDYGTKVLTSDGNFGDVEYILSPTKITEGKYAITVTKLAKDLYKIDGKNIVIETRYCYEFATRQEVIFVVESNYGFSKGKIYF